MRARSYSPALAVAAFCLRPLGIGLAVAVAGSLRDLRSPLVADGRAACPLERDLVAGGLVGRDALDGGLRLGLDCDPVPVGGATSSQTTR